MTDIDILNDMRQHVMSDNWTDHATKWGWEEGPCCVMQYLSRVCDNKIFLHFSVSVKLKKASKATYQNDWYPAINDMGRSHILTVVDYAIAKEENATP